MISRPGQGGVPFLRRPLLKPLADLCSFQVLDFNPHDRFADDTVGGVFLILQKPSEQLGNEEETVLINVD